MKSDAQRPARTGLGPLIGRYIIYLPLAGFVVNLAIALAVSSSDWPATTLDVALTWLVGVSGLIFATGHLFMPSQVAAGIGWPTSRFQWEVGLANAAYGVAGIMAPSFDRGFQLATIIVFSIFMLGAAVGHVRSMRADRNLAPGNAGYVFWYDILGPIALIALYAASG
jgi:hypothetical protein